MKKIYACIGLAVLSWNLSAQQQFQGVNFGDMPKPVPSVSSFSTYTDTPASPATGIPAISIPLLSLPGDGGSALSLALSYNPLNASGEEPGSEAGTGWSVFKGGVISRQINGTIDEAFQNPSHPNYEKNKFNDEYYYNLPGLSGKFKIERDVAGNTFTLVDLTPLNHVKIEYTRQDNNATLIVDSFTITDDEGTRYYFSDYSSNAVYDGYYESIGAWGLEYKSAFYLTSIKNAGNVEVARFMYKHDTKYDGSMLMYKSSRLESIRTSSGSIAIAYDYDQALEKTMNDPYSIKSISLSNLYAKVAEYAFEYSYPEMSYSEGTEKRRRLEKVKKMSGTAVLEETSFVYYPQASTEPSQNTYCAAGSPYSPSNVLKRIIYPTKGMTEYLYEKSDIFKDKNNAAYLESISDDFRDACVQYTEALPDTGFDTNASVSYTFSVSGDPGRKKAFWLNFSVDEYYQQPGPVDPKTGFPTLPPPLKDNQRISYTLKRGSETIASSQRGEYTRFYYYPGQYTLTINVPYVGGNGYFQLTELMLRPGPYRNADVSGNRYRIQSVKTYNDPSASSPEKTVSYSYDSFTLANSSSGYLSMGKDIVYKNVKVTEGTGNGHTRYFYRAPQDYPVTDPYVKDGQSGIFWPYYNLTRAGLAEKREIFNEAGQLLNRESSDYTFSTANDTDYAEEGFNYSKTAWISASRTTSETYPSGDASAVLTGITENTFRTDNYKPSYSKSTAADGTVTESFYRYAADKNMTALLSANMTGIQVAAETRKNGKTTGQSETRFDNASLKYPSSVVSVNPNDGSVKTAVTYDVYDDRGNIVQYTTDIDPLSGKGNPVTIIWGYNKTMPIAKVPGARWADIASLAGDIIARSDADTSEAKEKELLSALDAFRDHAALRPFPVITYTYDPLIGVTTVTPPTGLRETYRYDASGRLESVTDADGNRVKEVKYNNRQ